MDFPVDKKRILHSLPLGVGLLLPIKKLSLLGGPEEYASTSTGSTGTFAGLS